MAYEDWPTHEALAKVKAVRPIMFVGKVLNVTSNIDAHVTLRGNGRVVSFEPMQDAWIKPGLKEVSTADTVDIEARGPDAVIIVAALRKVIEGKSSLGLLHKVQAANAARGGPSLAPYTVVSHSAWMGDWLEFFP